MSMCPRAPRRGSRAGRIRHAWPRPGVWRVPRRGSDSPVAIPSASALLHAWALAHCRLHVKASILAAHRDGRSAPARQDTRPARTAPIRRSRAYRVGRRTSFRNGPGDWDETLASSVPVVGTAHPNSGRPKDACNRPSCRMGHEFSYRWSISFSCLQLSFFLRIHPSSFWTAHRRRIVRSEQTKNWREAGRVPFYYLYMLYTHGFIYRLV